MGIDVAADIKKTTAPVQLVEKKKWNLWAIFLGVIAVIGFIAEIPSIRYNLQPHFQLETLQPVDKDNMYNFDHLLLKNTGILDISNAEVKCEPLINDTASHIFISDLVVGSPPIPLLEAGGAGATIPCFFLQDRHPFPQDSQMKITVHMKGTYGFSVFRKHFDKDFHYLSTANSEGRLIYHEQP
ncbi:hypothetical protein [Tunturiibacter gelidoferens]|uniref:Uncharacterized protein n=1 Tax=Tunturiibacter lichenicola TaxID=2051959 RepID=A0A7Y9T4D8_9BACT|nr:hypothetical protein [Edaphobacter lichenicola]NYF51284.1 hypothetical protein [Edaphobacter lichenicola]